MMARANIAAFPVERLDAIIINAAGCGAMLKEYPLLIDGAGSFSAKVKDICGVSGVHAHFRASKQSVEQRVGYDDPCHLIHGQGVKTEPRKLLKAIPGIEFVEVEGADQCCGSAGIYNITQNELSMEILDRKMEKIQKAEHRYFRHRKSRMHVSVPVWGEEVWHEARSAFIRLNC